MLGSSLLVTIPIGFSLLKSYALRLLRSGVGGVQYTVLDGSVYELSFKAAKTAKSLVLGFDLESGCRTRFPMVEGPHDDGDS